MRVTIRTAAALVLGAALIAVGSAGSLAQSDPVSAGNGILYIGSYPNVINIIDEASERIVDRIQVKSGIPRNLSFSRDRKRFYMLDATMQTFEVVEIATKTTIDTFTLGEGRKLVRFRSYEVDPQERYLIALAKTATKLVDRWEIAPTSLLQIDLKTHQVMRTIPWPNNQERENANIRFSPDGKYLYFFSDQDILIYETAEFKQVDKWELSKPIEEGFGRLSLGSQDVINEEPGFSTGLFTVEDPVNNRRMMGIARVNLQEKKVDFHTIGPANQVTFTLAPGRKRAFGLMSQIGQYEFWQFDLETFRVVDRVAFPGRPRMGVRVSSNGKVLYIYVAGATIDLYDASTYQYLRTIWLDGDMTTELYVTPGSPARTER